MLSATDTEQLLSQFPEVVFAFAYGSGVVEQGGYDYDRPTASLPLLDLILVVEDSEAWHAANMARNPHHYTSMLPLSPHWVARVQERVQAHFWFNAYVPANLSSSPQRLMKYGVVSKRHVLRDLLRWTDLYAAGRLHKPVQVLRSNAEVEAAMCVNREQAVRASLLLLPESFQELDLYLTVASLSYTGDPRMLVGENPNKVKNLVTPIVSHYRSLYERTIDKITTSAVVTKLNGSEIAFAQNVSPASRWELCTQLPANVQRALSLPSKEKVLPSTMKPPSSAAVRSALAHVVSRSATMQTVKGLFTVGIVKSSSYVLAKMAKRFLAPTTK